MEFVAHILRINHDPATGLVTGGQWIDFSGNEKGDPVSVETAWAANEVAHARVFSNKKGEYFLNSKPTTLQDVLLYFVHQAKTNIVVMENGIRWPEGAYSVPERSPFASAVKATLAV